MKISYKILWVIILILGCTGTYYVYKFHSVQTMPREEIKPEMRDRVEARETEVMNEKDEIYNARIITQFKEKWREQLGHISSIYGFSAFYSMEGLDVFHVEGDDEDEPVFAYTFMAKDYILDTRDKLSSDEQDLLSILIDERLIQYPVMIGVYDPNRYISDLTKYAEDLINAELADSRSNQNIILNHDAWTSHELANRQWMRLDYQKQIMVKGVAYPVSCSEYFIHENDMIIRISLNTLDDGGVDENLSAMAKKIKESSLATVESFVFDGSTTNYSGRSDLADREYTVDSNRIQEQRKLLEQLRREPYYDQEKKYEYETFGTERCDDRSDEGKNEEFKEYGLIASPTGAYFEISSVCFDKTMKSCATIHGYDQERRHTGPIDPRGVDMEENARGYRILNMPQDNYVIAVREFDPGTIEIKGVGYGMVTLHITGDGNSCTFAQVKFYITPYAVAKIPIKSTGEVGPISYDVDGDKKIDVEISLEHPLIQEKEDLLIRIINDMYMGEGCLSGEISQDDCEKYFSNK